MISIQTSFHKASHEIIQSLGIRNKITLTDFLPGMAHSQFIKFNVPSGFLVGLATNP